MSDFTDFQSVLNGYGDMGIVNLDDEQPMVNGEPLAQDSPLSPVSSVDTPPPPKRKRTTTTIEKVKPPPKKTRTQRKPRAKKGSIPVDTITPSVASAFQPLVTTSNAGSFVLQADPMVVQKVPIDWLKFPKPPKKEEVVTYQVTKGYIGVGIVNDKAVIYRTYKDRETGQDKISYKFAIDSYALDHVIGYLGAMRVELKNQFPHLY